MSGNEKSKIDFENARNFVINNILLVLLNKIDNVTMNFGKTEKEGKKEAYTYYLKYKKGKR